MNVGTGRATTVREVAEVLSRTLRVGIPLVVNEKFREGDIRHCVADIPKAQQLLGYQPRVTFPQGMEELTAWVVQQTAEDRAEVASDELERRGLTR